MKIKKKIIFGAKQVSGQIHHKDTDNNQNEENESPHCKMFLTFQLALNLNNSSCTRIITPSFGFSNHIKVHVGEATPKLMIFFEIFQRGGGEGGGCR